MNRVKLQNLIILIIALIGVTIFFTSSKDIVKPDTNSLTDSSADSESLVDTTLTDTTSVPAEKNATINQEGVVLLFHTIDSDKANEKHKLISGRVQNKGKIIASSVIVNAKIYDSNGNQIATAFARPLYNDLQPGQISWFYLDVYEYFSNYSLSVEWKNGN